MEPRPHVATFISAADVLLWRKKHLSAGFLGGATVVWFVFEWIGYHFISVIAFLLLGFVVILFTWSNGAAFLNRFLFEDTLLLGF